MTAYHDLIDTLYDLLMEDDNISTVTKGGDIDMNKNNQFNLAHVNVLNSGFNNAVITFDVAVFAMALRDLNKGVTKDKWTENDNENENLNDMLYVLHRLYLKLNKRDDVIELTNVEPLEPFTEARNNVVDGWVMRFTVSYVENDSSAC